MGKYHFVKVGQVNETDKGSTWYFIPQSYEQLFEHWDKYAGALMKAGMDEVVQHILDKAHGLLSPHYTTTWGSLVEQMSSIKGLPYWEVAHEEENKLFNQRIEMFEKNDEILLSDGLTVFSLIEGFTEIKEHVYKDTLEYPSEKFSIDDVRYIQWDGGKHWYAKIGNFDIVYEGDQKWNSKLEAEIAVKQYFKKHQNN